MVTPILPLRIEGAHVRRKSLRLIGPVDLEIAGTGLTIVMGPNGSGKTSLLRLMHGLERADEGRLEWAVPEVEARAAQGYVFQRPTMMRRSVIDSIAYPLLLRGVSRRDAATQAQNWAERVGLGDAVARPARVLSGGERQKLALARALIRAPQILFLDEPCANLDGAATREIEALLRDVVAGGTRVVMATHDIGQARRLANEVVFLLNGHLHETGPADAFFAGPATPEAAGFLGGQIVD